MESIKENDVDNKDENLISFLKKDISGSVSLVSKVVSVSIFLIGGLFFFTYFVSIRYMPVFDVQESIFIFIAVAALGSLIFFGYLLAMFFPILQWISCYSPKTDIENRKNDFLVSYGAWFLLFTSIFFQSIYIVLVVLLISLLIVFCCTSSLSIKDSNPTSKEKKQHKVKIFWYGLQSVSIGLFSTFVLYFLFIGIERNFQPLNNISELIVLALNFSFLCAIILCISMFILHYWEKHKSLKISNFINFLAIVIISSIFIPYVTGSANAIPYVVMRNFRIGALVDSNIVVDYKGCQIVEKIDPSILSPQITPNSTIAQPKQSNICANKNKDTVYMISNIDIQVTLGDSLFLKYPSISSVCDDSSKGNQKKCVSKTEKKFHLPKKYVLSYFVQGQDVSINQP